jgi:indolepyruvate ferredoxin oxidoreductase
MNDTLPESVRRALEQVSLEDKWTVERGRVYMSGTQALVRLMMLQRQRDLIEGRNTAGFLTGYRGSPLGTVDITAERAKPHLERHHIRFQPGVNEDLAATALWGTQQVNMFPGARYDGVFGMWYGKGPGADRCGDVFKHANAAGTSPWGGVVAAVGDDHGAKSSTLPHQSDHVFKACLIPLLFPASVQEYLDLGLHAYAMSRYAGLWVGMKCVTEVVEASSSVIIDPTRVDIRLPGDFVLPAQGLNIRWPDTPLAQEARLLDYKLYAALSYCRENRLNRTVVDAPDAKFGIVASGKAYLDTRQALLDLGLDDEACRQLGIRIFKCAMVWPLEAHSISAFAEGLSEILVIEEKRQVIEYQLKEELFQWIGTGRRIPRVIGKFDEKDGGEWAVPQGNWILPAHYEFSPAIVAKAIAARIARHELPADLRRRIESRLALIEAKEREAGERSRVPMEIRPERVPYFCPGCPHNTSTRVPEGSRAVAGIGCHYMVTWMDRRTSTFSQMGGEGVPWIGQAPFTTEAHIFANLGDGTYFHSGILAIRAAVAAGVSMTYKILYNDAVAMTGGQSVDGILDVPRLTRQVAAEGVTRIVIVAEDPQRLAGTDLAPGVRIEPRARLDAVQRELREVRGVTILLYDQTCAAEKRRRRKRGLLADPATHVRIQEQVCEGCGDCSEASNCLAVEPVDTEFGRKRRIQASACNKDYSCVLGFCPSFVTIEHGRPRRRARSTAAPPAVPLPKAFAPAPGSTFGILVAGVGGTGVVTIGQLLGMAAHIEGLGISVLDVAGLAQKGGAVHSFVQIATAQETIYATRIATGEADLVLGCDLVVSAGQDVISRMQRGRTHMVLSSSESPTAAFVRNPDWRLDGDATTAPIRAALGSEAALLRIDAQRFAERVLGDSIYANPLVLGAAWQKGWIPLRRESLLRAIELNGSAVEANRRAFEWGRAIAHDPALDPLLHPAGEAAAGAPQDAPAATTLEGVVHARAQALREYQDEALARRYRARIDQVREAERRVTGAEGPLAMAAARNLHRLLAVKDEFEVARLLTSPAFRARIAAEFEQGWRLHYHLAPAWLARPGPHGERPRKRRYGPWMGLVLRGIASLRFVRGGAFDPFGYTEERRTDRALLAAYEETIDEILAGLRPENHALACRLADAPAGIRGYGPVRERSVLAARPAWEALRMDWQRKTGSGG